MVYRLGSDINPSSEWKRFVFYRLRHACHAMNFIPPTPPRGVSLANTMRVCAAVSGYGF